MKNSRYDLYYPKDVIAAIDESSTPENSVISRLQVVEDSLETVEGSLVILDNILDNLYLETHHVSQYFPEDSDETIIFVAGETPNVFGEWIEIVDNNAVTFSSKLTTCISHISSVLVENADTKDKIYLYEISYGLSKTVVIRGRILSATNLLDTIQQGRRRSLHIPEDETVYYRMKCETGEAELQVSFRYHRH